MLSSRSLVAAVVVLATVAGACGAGSGDDGGARGSRSQNDEIVVQAANYEIVAGEKTRFIAGVLTPDQLYVSYGTVDMEFFYLGTEQGEGKAEPGPTATGRFLVIEGDPDTRGPVAGPASEGRGVYAADVTLDEAGFWAVQLTADLEDGGSGTGRAVFEVLDEHRLPAPGDPAPKSRNLTLGSDEPPAAIDSRAESAGDVPDAILHETRIADSIANEEPALVVFSTPVYCVSRFCGPITDMVEELARDYEDRANFIHVEIWFNFQKQVLNKTTGQWLFRGRDLHEPWIFLVGSNGKIVARWDNVATRGEIEPLLKELPRLR